MKEIETTISVYERLRAKQYRITIPELGESFLLCFKPEHYHHLAGFQYLTDLPDIADCPKGSKHFYRLLKNGTYQEEALKNSIHFSDIAERIFFFPAMEDILSTSPAKIIVSFDNVKAKSLIHAEFYLFKRNGSPLKGDSVTYCNLFIDRDAETGIFYPVTFIVEHSTQYIHDQTLYDCTIEEIPVTRRTRRIPIATSP